MPIKYIGRTTNCKGKPLWEILANLKNFGVGRMIIRSNQQRYPEPSFIRILKVAALPTPPSEAVGEERKVMVLVERTFRGVKLSKPVQIDRTSYKADYILIPKDEEAKFLQPVEKKISILPRTIEMPPLLKEFTIRQLKAAGKPIPETMKVKAVYSNFKNKSVRVAEEGEEPTIKLDSLGLGTPASPQLYANIKEDVPEKNTPSN